MPCLLCSPSLQGHCEAVGQGLGGRLGEALLSHPLQVSRVTAEEEVFQQMPVATLRGCQLEFIQLAFQPVCRSRAGRHA